MTAEEAVKRLTAKVECMERENSGTDLDCDECELCYAQGTLSEQIEALKVALSALQEQEAKAQLSAEGTTNLQQTCNNLATDTISRQALCEYALNQKDKSVTPNDIMRFPSVQPELTDDRAIKHLQSTGWMQNHDKEMYEMGLRERLADDSGSYDSLIPSGDTILRQAAIDAFEDTTFTKNEIQRRLSELPSAQPEPDMPE